MTQEKKGIAPKIANATTGKVGLTSQSPSLEDLLRENEDLKSRLKNSTRTNKPEKLEDLLKFYKERNRKINELSVYEKKSKELQKIEKDIKTSLRSQDLENVPNIYFSFYAPNSDGYSSQEVLKIANYEILVNVVNHILGILNERIIMLENEIKS